MIYLDEKFVSYLQKLRLVDQQYLWRSTPIHEQNSYKNIHYPFFLNNGHYYSPLLGIKKFFLGKDTYKETKNKS
jgi:hypothetical protein